MNNKDLLVVKNLSKFFQQKGIVVNAVSDVSFKVKRGEIMGLIGESGSGKTTIGNSLIRLYDSYSGFVSLDGHVISGKKLSKKSKKFLYKNMQMIFQDPHASLDPQKNIYSILKEPLIVNKIIKEDFQELIKDWNLITNNFKLTFLEKFQNIEIKNKKNRNSQHKKFIEEACLVLDKINFDNLSIENMNEFFNEYMHVLDLKQKTASNIVNFLYKNNSILSNYYYEKQKEFRSNTIDEDEQKVIETKKTLDLTIELSSQSLNNYLSKNELKEIEKNKDNFIRDKKEEKIVIESMMNSFVQELKFNSNKKKNDSHSSLNKEDFLNNYKEFLVYKFITKIINKNKNKFLYAEVSKTNEFIESIKKIIADSIKKIFINKEDNIKDSKRFVNEIMKNYDLENIIKSFQNNSTDLKEEWKKSLDEINNKIKQINQNIKDSKTSYKNEFDIKKAEENYNNALSEFNWRLEKYKKEFDLRSEKNIEKIKFLIQEDLELDDEYSKLMKKFDYIHKNFIKKIEHQMKHSEYQDKKIKKEIRYFEQKVYEKKDILKTFQIETKNLESDWKELKILCGIEKNLFYKNKIKKLITRTKIYNALEEVGLLRQFAWRYPHEFSGGQRQRIVIARALISNPKLIIADEPIASLDISIQAQIVNILKDLCKLKDVALIFIAHDLSMVEYIADYINIMHLGKIVENGKTEKIYSNPRHPYTINLFNSIPKISNANEKFISSNFDISYLEDIKTSEVIDNKIEDDHFVYSTKEQFLDWTSGKNKTVVNNENLSVWNENEEVEKDFIKVG